MNMLLYSDKKLAESKDLNRFTSAIRTPERHPPVNSERGVNARV
jgi:hypothetical protein